MWWKHVSRKHIFKNMRLCKYCFSMLRDKILFVIKLQKLKKQVSFCHPSQRNEHIKMWETHPNDYWVFFKTADLLYHSFPGPPLSKMAAESNFPPWGCSIRMSISLPMCTSMSLIPSPPILRQTIDRCIIGYVHTVPGELSTA